MFSMLNTLSITHHYPTALALRAALSLPLSEPLMPAEQENRMGGEHAVQMLSVKLSWHAVCKIYHKWAHMEEEIVVQKLAKQEVARSFADEGWHRSSSVKSFWALEVI